MNLSLKPLNTRSTHHRTACVFFVSALLVPCHAAQIQGTVSSNPGLGGRIPGALVRVHRLAVGAPLSKTEAFVAIADAKGAFTVNGLTPGTFAVCITSRSTDYLDPCNWSTPPQVTVSSATQVATINLIVDKGNRIAVRVEDPDQLLPRSGKPRNGVFFEPLIVTPAGLNNPIPLVSTDRTGLNFEIVVPVNMDLKLKLESNNVKVLNSNGSARGKSDQDSVRVTPNAAKQQVQYRVTKPNP